MPPGMTQPQFDAMLKKSPPFIALQDRVKLLEEKLAFQQGQINAIGPAMDDLRAADAWAEGEIGKLDARVTKLETSVPELPVADCTVTQLPAPPYTMRMEATYAGPDATYFWRLGKNSDNDPDEDTATGRILEQVTYHEAGTRTVVLRVTNEAGSSEHTHTFQVEESAQPEPPEPEPPLPPDDEHGDLYSLDLGKVADNEALKKKWVLYEGDAVIGVNLNLVTLPDGTKVQRHDFDRRGLSCANDVSCQCGTPRHAPQQEVYDRLRFRKSPNWKSYDEKCAAQGDTVGDFKIKFIDTLGGYSGRSGGLLIDNNAQPGAPQGSLYMEESIPPKAPGVPSKGEWIGFTAEPDVTYEIRQRWKYSTTPVSNDGHNEVWIYRVNPDKTLTLVKNWKQTGFSTCGDTQDQPEFTDGGSICHNQSSGQHDSKMWIDVYAYDIWSAGKKPSWA